MNEETGVEYLTPWQVNNVIEGLGGLGVVERLPLLSKSNLANSFKVPTLGSLISMLGGKIS